MSTVFRLMRDHRPLAYGSALLLVVIATVLQLTLGPASEKAIFILYYPAIFISAWFMGAGPGILAVALAVSAHLLYGYGHLGLSSMNSTDALRLLVFSLNSLLIVWISARTRKTEMVLRNSENRFKVFFNTPAAGAVEVSTDEHFIRVNDAYCKLTGYSSDELLRMRVSDLSFPEDREIDQRRLAPYLRGDLDILEMTKRYRCKNGSAVWVQVHGALIRNSQGRPLYSIAQISNVTEQKDYERRLKQESQHKELALAAAHLGSWRFDPSKNIVHIDDRHKEMFGLAENQWSVESFYDMVFPEDRPKVLAATQRSMNAEHPESIHVQYRIKRKDGSIRWIEAYGLTDTEQVGKTRQVVAFGGTVADITDRVQLEASLREAIRTRDDFISIASHELKTPITTIQLQIQMQERMLQKAGTEVLPFELLRKSGALIGKQISRLTALVNDLLDVSRISAGKLTLNLEHTNLSVLLEEILVREKHSLESAKMHLTTEIQPGIEMRVDRLRIEQAVGNLISNASKYAAGAPVEVRLRKMPTSIRIEIQDHGPGIEPSKQDVIFQRYERAVSNHTGVSGLGLGLYITRQIIEAHHGKVWIESQPDSGSLFRIELPLTREAHKQ